MEGHSQTSGKRLKTKGKNRYEIIRQKDETVRMFLLKVKKDIQWNVTGKCPITELTPGDTHPQGDVKVIPSSVYIVRNTEQSTFTI